MKLVMLIVVLVLVFLAFHPVQPLMVAQRRDPAYIDQPAMYYDKEITYSEWP
jgi:hypothetical protein